jgi:TetR/AcrR family transcriptional regulator, lmrAB and yxaGH operons repressor
MPRRTKKIEPNQPGSRERLVRTAARLLRVQGYHATGLSQIVEESRAPKGSLYHYFPDGKEQLAEEALDCAGQELSARMKGLQNLGPAEALDRMVEFSIGELEASHYRDGCPIATVALETHSTSEPLRLLCCSIFEQVLANITEGLMARGLCRERAESLALTVFSAYEGALLLSKVRRSPEPLRQVAGQLKRYVNLVLG